ncbi:hypothetical protein [Paraglaciecola sp.]|uniref:hypothetical protein n=1 Tax=Paraglaciecola sp. TaxID=1920173 RepID=UPI0030F3710D
MKEDEFHNLGGSIEQSLQGNTKLDLKALAKEAWMLTQQAKSGLLQGAMIIVLLGLLLISGLQHFFEVEDWATAPPKVRLILQVSLTIITAPFVAAMLMIGISHSVGEKPTFSLVLKKVINSALVILLALLVSVLVDLGFALFLLPGIYLGLATGFAMMLYIEKQLPPSQAILQSIKVFNRYWPQLSLFYVITILLFTLGMFTFGFAYIWIIPFYFNFKGVLYRELFGIKIKMVKADSLNNQGDSIFHA